MDRLTTPPFQVANDAIVDLSCPIKANILLCAHGYPDAGAFLVPSSGARRVQAHLWLSQYKPADALFF